MVILKYVILNKTIPQKTLEEGKELTHLETFSNLRHCPIQNSNYTVEEQVAFKKHVNTIIINISILQIKLKYII